MGGPAPDVQQQPEGVRDGKQAAEELNQVINSTPGQPDAAEVAPEEDPADPIPDPEQPAAEQAPE